MAQVLHSRQAIGLRPPLRALDAAPRRRRELWLHHSVTVETADVFRDWRAVQAAAFGRRFSDISYTFGSHRRAPGALEGRSPDKVGAHTAGHNTAGHAICMIGNYENIVPSEEQVAEIRWLRYEMVQRGLLVPEHSFGVHRAIVATACPGAQTMIKWELIKKPWDVLPDTPPPPATDDWMERIVAAKPTLKKGDRNHQVKLLQAALAAHAQDLAMYFSHNDIDLWVDGSFGDNTEYVLAAWKDRIVGQPGAEQVRAEGRGTCGPATWAWLLG